MHRTTATLLVLAALGSGLAAPAATAEPALLIDNVTLIDGTGRAPVSPAAVLIRGERIDRVARGSLTAEGEVRRIDGGGKFLLPGLMDLHIHLQGGTEVTPEGLRKAALDRAKGIRALHSYLYSGVTSLYDAGNISEYILGLRADERAGAIVSPRIFATGAIVTYPGSHGGGEFATEVDDWPEAIPKLDAHIGLEPDLLKLTYEERGWGSRPMIPRLPVDLMQQIIEYYNAHGIRTTVHTSSELRARQAIFAGVDTLAHPIIQGPVSDGFVNLMAAKGTPMVTTLTIGDNYGRLVDDPEYLDRPLYRAVLTKAEIERLKTEVRAEYEARKWTQWMKVMTTIAQENLKRLSDAGAVLAAGTDQTIGPALHRELELLSDAGIPNAEIIRIATLNGAVFLGRERDLGSVEEGKLADLILIEADPLADIANLERIGLVIKGGKIIDRAALDLPANR